MQKRSQQILLYMLQTHFTQSSSKNYAVRKEGMLCIFGLKLGDQDKAFAPHMCCKTCVESLRLWSITKIKSLPFGIPMVWREVKNHVADCYFCMTNLQGMDDTCRPTV